MLYARPAEAYRIGFLGGRRAGTAVRRNAAKRRIREVWKRRFRTGDFLFVLKSLNPAPSSADFARELGRLADTLPWPRS